MALSVTAAQRLCSTQPDAAVSPFKQRRWWRGLTLDQQLELLLANDPADDFKFGRISPIRPAEFNKQRRRITAAQKQWTLEVAHLRKRCYCDGCRGTKRHQPQCVGSRGLFYECWLNLTAKTDRPDGSCGSYGQQDYASRTDPVTGDPDPWCGLDESLAAIRDDRPRIGSAIIGRSRSAV